MAAINTIKAIEDEDEQRRWLKESLGDERGALLLRNPRRSEPVCIFVPWGENPTLG